MSAKKERDADAKRQAEGKRRRSPPQLPTLRTKGGADDRHDVKRKEQKAYRK